MLKYRFKQDDGNNYPDWEETKIINIAKKNKISINPCDTPNTMFYEYSMPAFDGGKIPQYVEGNSMNSNRFVIQENVVLFNKLNVRKKRIWSVHNPNLNSVCSSEFIPVYPNGIYQDFLAQLFSTDKFTNLMKGMSKGTSNSQKRINPDKFWETNIIIPCPDEQQKIADFLFAVDNQINIQRQRVKTMELQKKGLVDKVFSQELRFKQNDGNDYPDWEKTTIKKVCIVNPRNTIDDEEFYYIDLESVDAGRLISENIIQKSEAPSRAKRLLSIDDVLFQSVRSYEMNHYHFKNAKAKQVVASTGFAQLRMKNGYNGFLYQLLFTKSFNSEVKKRSTGLYATINSSSLKEVPVTIPESIEEQQKIADFFTAIDNQIDIEKQRLATMETIKKGLLQQMFC